MQPYYHVGNQHYEIDVPWKELAPLPCLWLLKLSFSRREREKKNTIFFVFLSPTRKFLYLRENAPSMKRVDKLVAELPSSVGLSKGPTWWCSIVWEHTATITSGDQKGKTLSIKVGVALPVLAPIPWHGLPSGSWTFYGHRMHITSTSNISHKD